MIIGQVNSYPGVRGFTAIGTGGDDFVQSMIVAVESVLQQPIPEVIVLSIHIVYLSLHSADVSLYVVPYMCGLSKKLKFMLAVSDEIRPDNIISCFVF